MDTVVLWTYEELAKYLQVSVRTAKKYVAEEKIPHLNISGTIRFDPDAIHKWAKSRTVKR